MKKKIISVLLSLQMMVNCIPFTAFAVGETTDTTASDTTIVENDNTSENANSDMLEGDEGSTTTTAASEETESTTSTEATTTAVVTPETPEQEEPSKQQTSSEVTELTLVVGEQTIYYGQPVPEIDYWFVDEAGNPLRDSGEEYIKEFEGVTITINYSNNITPFSVADVGDYDVNVTIANYTNKTYVFCGVNNEQNPNVNASGMCKENQTGYCTLPALKIKEYNPGDSVAATIDSENYVENQGGVTLTAPEGHQIGLYGSDWAGKVTWWPEKDKYQTTYYLKNTNPEAKDADGIPLEGAICTKTIQLNAADLPEITATVEKADPTVADQILNFLSGGLYSKDKVTLTITTEETALDDATITLKSNGNEIASTGTFSNQKYVLTHTFDLGTYGNLTVEVEAHNVTDYYNLSFNDDGSIYVGVEKTGRIVLENELPVVKFENNRWNNTIYFRVKDEQSGLKEVKYSTDNEKWERKIYADELKYDDYITVENAQTVYVIVTDNAGNTHEISSSDSNADISAFTISAYEETTDETTGEAGTVTPLPETVCNFYDYGVFANGAIELKVKFTSQEVSNVALVRYESENHTWKERAYFVQDPEDKTVYTCILECDADGFREDYAAIYYKVGPHNENTIPLADVLENDEVESNLIVVENTVPELTYDISDYYNASGEIQLTLNDDISNSQQPVSGIYNWDVKAVPVDAEGTAIGDSLPFTMNFVDEEGKSISIDQAYEALTIKGSTSQLPDGKYRLVGTIKDNAGNELNEFKTSIFTVDTEDPEGTIEFVETEYGPKILEENKIDERYWYNLDDRANVTMQLTVTDDNFDYARIGIQDANSDSEWYYVNVNAGAFTSGTNGELVYTFTIADLFEDVQAPVFQEEQVFVVLNDHAGNHTTEKNTDLRLYINYDKQAPEITSLTVEKADPSAAEQMLTVLTFGIFSNDKVKLTANVKEEDFDSGIQSVVLKCFDENGILTEARDGDPSGTKTNGNGKYVWEFSVEDANTVFSSYFSITVTDKIGNTNDDKMPPVNCDKNNVPEELETSHFIMLEQISPTIDPHMEFSDLAEGLTSRDDDEIWYNADHPITVEIQDANSGLSECHLYVNDTTEITTDANGTVFWNQDARDSFGKMKVTPELYTIKTDDIIAAAGGIPEDGKFVLQFTADDNCGNPATKSKTFYIDKTTPEITNVHFTIPDAGGIQDVQDLSKYVMITDYGFYFKQDLNLVVDVDDDGQENKSASSGLYEVQYQFIPVGATAENVEIKSIKIDQNGQVSITVPAEFKGHIKLEAIDYVGNSSGAMTLEDALVLDTPEKHAQEAHFEISDPGATPYTDAKGQPLYTDNVTYTVSIIDTVSGIRDFSYAMQSEQETYEMRTIAFNNYDYYSVGADLGDGWRVAEVDVNLVTKVTKTFTITENNDVVLSFAMKDRAGNTSEDRTSPITVDTTIPTVNVTYADAETSQGNVGNYYRNDRMMTVTVTERNFDPGRMQVLVNGAPAGITFSGPAEGNVYTGTVLFEEGDYVIAVSGTDRGDHPAEVTYQDNMTEFFVDKSDPLLVTNFAELVSPGTQNHFNMDKTVQITVTEHNFDPAQANITVMSAGPEAEGKTEKNSTSDFVTNWVSNGDEHTMTLKAFGPDGVYQVSVAVTDRSGRSATEASVVYEIDQTPPKHNAPDNTVVHIIDEESDKIPGIEIQDDNFKEMTYTLTSYRIESDEQGVGYKMVTDQTTDTLTTGKMQPAKKNFEEDGVYEYTLTACDISGNVLENVKVTYVVKRNSEFMVYIPDSYDDEDNDKDRGLYAFDQKGTKADDFEDVQLEAYLPTGNQFTLQIDGETVSDEYLTIQEDRDSIHLTTHYSVTLSKEYITTYYNDAVDVELLLNAVATGSGGEQTITMGRIFIDNVAPDGTYEDEILDLGYFDGFFGVASKTIRIQGVSSDLYKNVCTILDNDEPLDMSKVKYDSERNELSFELPEGSHILKVTLVDNAGNTTDLETPPMIYIGSFWKSRLFRLIAAISAVIVAAVAIVVIAILKKKNTKNVI